MLEKAQPLLVSLAASIALHVAAATGLQIMYGAPAGTERAEGTQAGVRQLPLRVTFLGSTLAPPEALPEHGKTLREGKPQPDTPAGQPGVPGLYYFTPHELSRRPQAASDVQIDYPEESGSEEGGRIVLRLLINELGTVDRIVVETDDAPKTLEQLALGAFTHARFRPGMRDNRPVKSQMLVEVTLDPNAPASGSAQK